MKNRKEVLCCMFNSSLKKDSYEASVKEGVSIAGSAAAGRGVATMVPSAMMGTVL